MMIRWSRSQLHSRRNRNLSHWRRRLLNGSTASTQAVLDNISRAQVNRILGRVLEIGWTDMYFRYLTIGNSDEPDAELLDWLLYGKSFNVNDGKRRISAYVAVQRESHLHDLMDFFRKSDGDINFSDEIGQTILHVFIRSYMHYLPKKTMFKVVKQLMEMGASVDAVDVDNYTVFHLVAEERDKGLMKLMLPRFTNVTAASGDYGDTVLLDVVYACNGDNSGTESQYAGIVRELLVKGADPNIRNRYGITPVHRAVEYNFIVILNLFRSHGADFLQLTSDGETLLHIACNRDKNPSTQLKIIELLVREGCDPNATDRDGQSPVHYAAKLRCTEILERLIQAGGNVYVKSRGLGVTPLHLAALLNQPSNVATLLKYGAEVDAEAKNGVTPLHIAAASEGLKTVKYLIKYGADVHRREKNFGFTPLHLAMSGSKKKVQLLLKQHVDINAANRDGITPLHLAALAGNAKVVEVLIKNDAEINCRGSWLKLTPMHLVSINNDVNLARHFIFDNKDLRNKTFFEMFKWVSIPRIDRENMLVARLLVRSGSDVNVKDGLGRTPLHLATLQTENDMIETLLRLGAHVDEYDEDYQTPLSNVLNSNSSWGLECLLKFGLDINDDDTLECFELCSFANSVHLQMHAMKLHMLGLPVRDEYNCFDESHEEIDLLQLRMIDTENSLFQFMHMNLRRQRSLVKKVLSMDLEDDFPNYADVVHATCCHAVVRVSLMEPALEALNQLSGTGLPIICAEHIFSFLGNRHLRAMIDAAEQINSD